MKKIYLFILKRMINYAILQLCGLVEVKSRRPVKSGVLLTRLVKLGAFP